MTGLSGLPVISTLLSILATINRLWIRRKRGTSQFDVHYLRKVEEHGDRDLGVFKVNFLNQSDRKFAIKHARVVKVNGEDVVIFGGLDEEFELAPHDYGDGTQFEFEYFEDGLLKESGNTVVLRYYIVYEQGGRWVSETFTDLEATDEYSKWKNNEDK